MRDRESESENSRLDLLFTEVTLAKLSDSLVSVLVHYMSSVLSTKRSKYYLQHLILHDVLVVPVGGQGAVARDSVTLEKYSGRDELYTDSLQLNLLELVPEGGDKPVEGMPHDDKSLGALLVQHCPD